MIIANKDIINFYNKIIEARKKIQFIKNDYNRDITIYINNKLVDTFTEEELKVKGII